MTVTVATQSSSMLYSTSTPVHFDNVINTDSLSSSFINSDFAYSSFANRAQAVSGYSLHEHTFRAKNPQNHDGLLKITNYSELPKPNQIIKSNKVSSSHSGFTLVEIVVVVVIISIFAGMMSLSVGSSESRKNRAFYEHLTDSLSYVRLLSSERMQPMGLRLEADKQGQVQPVIVTLSNPYVSYQNTSGSSPNDSIGKNAMELTAMSGSADALTPSWDIESEITLPELPAGVSLRIESLDAGYMSGDGAERRLQPWFSDQSVPQVLWFGTGQATPVTIEVLHDNRLVSEVISILPDGSLSIGQGL